MTQQPITQILPAPFAWVNIPEGSVTLTDDGGYLDEATSFDVAAFSIAKYPVTNAQYAAFLDAADGFDDDCWWDFSDDAREWRLENSKPLASFGDGTHPRTHIAWYDAIAFGRWLSHLTGEQITLPTEQQWQLAAQGSTHQAFPWGDAWDIEHCTNNLRSQSIGTTPVTRYEGRGDSPYGVVDMVGNAWEWTLTSWNTGKADLNGDDVRVERGGSWFEDKEKVYQVTTRSSWTAYLPSDLRGFRLVKV